MAQSWRIKTVEVDRTDKTTTSTPIIGATVVISPKGPKKFMRFNRGDVKSVLETFGYPSKNYPSIQDALDVVSKCSMYIASPYKGGTYGGVFVTKSLGTIPFNKGVVDKEIEDYSSVEFTNDVDIANGTTTSFEYTVPYAPKYIAESLSILVDDVVHNVAITSNEGIETITDADSESPIFDEGCTFNTETGVLTLKTINPLISGTKLSIKYNMNMSDTYFVLFDKDMQEDDIKVQVKLSEDVEDAFDISVFRYDPVELEYDEIARSPFTVGLSETSKNTYGDNIFIENIFNDNQTLFDVHVVNSEIDGFHDDIKAVPLAGGSRGDEVDGADVATIYDQLVDISKYQLKFCVDGTGKHEVVPKFENLRNNYQKHCRFIYPTDDVDGETIVNSPSTYNYGVTGNRGMYQYCLNWGIHQDTYQGNNFRCSNMGLIAGRIVDMLDVGSGCPAWIDENGVGGILGSSIVRLSQDGCGEDILEQLDNLNFNAVVFDYNYGAMIVGWRTRQVKKTVYSNIPQSSLADTIIELIENEILPSRIGKIIDEGSYSVVTMGINSILSSYSQYLEDYYVWCDSSNNTPEMREKEQLVVAVGIVFKNYARTILLQFMSFRNGVSVQEEMMK